VAGRTVTVLVPCDVSPRQRPLPCYWSPAVQSSRTCQPPTPTPTPTQRSSWGLRFVPNSNAGVGFAVATPLRPNSNVGVGGFRDTSGQACLVPRQHAAGRGGLLRQVWLDCLDLMSWPGSPNLQLQRWSWRFGEWALTVTGPSRPTQRWSWSDESASFPTPTLELGLSRHPLDRRVSDPASTRPVAVAPAAVWLDCLGPTVFGPGSPRLQLQLQRWSWSLNRPDNDRPGVQLQRWSWSWSDDSAWFPTPTLELGLS
jgi:energy-converting hydrogenase Eha subunit A